MSPNYYIGERRIEYELEQYKNKESIEIEWESFQLKTNFVASEDDNIYDHLAEKYSKNKKRTKEGCFFVFDNKNAMSGAQNTDTFLKILKKS